MRKTSLLIALAALALLCGCEDTRHKATIYKLKNHHIVLKDDQGRWYEYKLKNTSGQFDVDINFDIPWNSKGEMTLPRGGSWCAATEEEEEEVTVEGLATNAEDTTVDETDAGAVDGAGDVGGDDGGAGGDGGDGGGGDGGGGDGD
jgi:hypothetical protein